MIIAYKRSVAGFNEMTGQNSLMKKNILAHLHKPILNIYGDDSNLLKDAFSCRKVHPLITLIF